MRLAFRFSLFLLLAVQALVSQTFTGVILGTVRDSTGAVVPKVEITVINAGTGARVSAVTDEQGNFTAPLLPPGAYRLEASAPGFRRYQQDGIGLRIQQQAR
ncbi:MAG TPA: hypothetical protein DEH78_25755, partial [Solibacterales bacterium]|nr:hypothetical protein [Bryobacterales bacterium]